MNQVNISHILGSPKFTLLFQLLIIISTSSGYCQECFIKAGLKLSLIENYSVPFSLQPGLAEKIFSQQKHILLEVSRFILLYIFFKLNLEISVRSSQIEMFWVIIIRMSFSVIRIEKACFKNRIFPIVLLQKDLPL